MILWNVSGRDMSQIFYYEDPQGNLYSYTRLWGSGCVSVELDSSESLEDGELSFSTDKYEVHLQDCQQEIESIFNFLGDNDELVTILDDDIDMYYEDDEINKVTTLQQHLEFLLDLKWKRTVFIFSEAKAIED